MPYRVKKYEQNRAEPQRTPTESSKLGGTDPGALATCAYGYLARSDSPRAGQCLPTDSCGCPSKRSRGFRRLPVWTNLSGATNALDAADRVIAPVRMTDRNAVKGLSELVRSIVELSEVGFEVAIAEVLLAGSCR